MKIDVTRYCSLARAADFQDWMKGTAPDLHQELITHLKLGKDCSSNKNKMRIVYDRLKQRGLDAALVGFLKSQYPYMLIKEEQDISSGDTDIKLKPEHANIHKVFSAYRPGFLIIPQQYIFIGKDYVSVNNKVMNFIRSKVSTDYIILKSDLYYHGYVEYFDKRFMREVDKVTPDTRPIALYRAKYGIK